MLDFLPLASGDLDHLILIVGTLLIGTKNILQKVLGKREVKSK